MSDHVHVWGKPWVSINGERLHLCKISGCTARRTEGGPGSTPKLGE